MLDLRSYPLPLARYAVRVGSDGGVHVRVATDDPNAIVFEFFDHTGIGIDKGTERKIENLFFREDFRRTPMDEVGLLDFPSRALERYSGAFVQALNAQALHQANFRVVIDYAYGNASIVLPQILGSSGSSRSRSTRISTPARCARSARTASGISISSPRSSPRSKRTSAS